EVAYRIDTAKEGAQSVETKGDTAVRGCAVLEGLHEETELFFRLFGCESQFAEHQLLRGLIVDTNRPASDFVAVDHKIIRIRSDSPRVGDQQSHILGFWRGKGVMHSMKFFHLAIPFQQGEVEYPHRRVNVFITESQTVAHQEAQFVQLLSGSGSFACQHQDKVAGT